MSSHFSTLRVAQLIETDGPGGAEHVVAELSRALQAGGVETRAFLPAGGEGWLAWQLEGSGVAIESFRINQPFAPEVVRSRRRVRSAVPRRGHLRALPTAHHRHSPTFGGG